MNAIHRAWKWYFWASIILSVSLLIYDVMDGFVNQSWGELLYTAIGYAVDVLSLVCLYGFAWQIRIGKCQYWVLFLFINIIFFFTSTGYALFSNESNLIEDMGFGFIVTMFGVGIVLTLPMFIANFLYAFRNNHLWSSNT